MIQQLSVLTSSQRRFKQTLAWFRAVIESSWPHRCLYSTSDMTYLKTTRKRQFLLTFCCDLAWLNTLQSRHRINVQIHRDAKCQINICHLYTNFKKQPFKHVHAQWHWHTSKPCTKNHIHTRYMNCPIMFAAPLQWTIFCVNSMLPEHGQTCIYVKHIIR